MPTVALRKESVDRNFDISNPTTTLPRSLSVRRAWIEMSISVCWMALNRVALRKESVDRNVSAFDVLAVSAGRSP